MSSRTEEPAMDGMETKLVDGDMKALTAAYETLAIGSLDELQSKDYRQVLDIVDKPRLSGLGSILQLPQIVVCGDQSSGKSSVLEAITEVPFPRKENLCTRFATEIILRRSRTQTISTKIIPDAARPEDEKSKLVAFQQTLTDFTELPALIDKATEAMGLNDTTRTSRGNKAFTRDVLSIEIAGPDRPQITVVDLPGLIQTATEEQTDEDVKLIHDLVGEYLAEKRTIMLAVVSAKNDYANQVIIDKCRKADPEGYRTLGIVTKPDYLKPKSQNEAAWIDLVQNKSIRFQLGWHILKNRSEDELHLTFKERNSSEQSFFNTGAYRGLPSQNKGIDSLRTRLQQLLYKHLKSELPKLQVELKENLGEVSKKLSSVGEKRSTYEEQKRFLMNVSAKYQAIIQTSTDGEYRDDDFFKRTNATAGFEDPDNMRRLRAAVSQLNLYFASQIRQFGHKFRIDATAETAGTNSKDDPPEPKLKDTYAEAEYLQKTFTREEAVEWVKNLLVLSRGLELPGNFNPRLVSQLFREQTEHWKELALEHLNCVDILCRDLVRTVSNEVTFAEVLQRLQDLKLDVVLNSRRDNAVEELNKIIADTYRHPITYDPSYLATIEESRSKKTKAQIEEVLKQATIYVKGENMVKPEVISKKLKELVEPDMNKKSAEDALDSLLAYYKDKVPKFIENVVEQVVERHLIDSLAEHTLSPLIVSDMEEHEVAFIAAESEEITQKREFLEGQKAILEGGQEAFRKVMGAFR